MKKNFFYYLSPSILTGAVSLFVSTSLATYYLEPKDFGIIGIITVFSKLIGPLSSTGCGWVLGGNYYRIDSTERKELIFNILFLAMLLRTFWVIVLGLSGHVFLPKLIKSYESIFLLFFWILLITEWFSVGDEVVSQVVVLQEKGKVHALLDATMLLSYVIPLFICLAVLNLKTISLALAYLASALGGFIFSMVYIRKYMVLHVKARWIKEIVKRGFLTIPLSVFEFISNSLGKFFIERWMGLSQLGIYNHSLDYKQMFMMPLRAFKRVFSPEVLAGFSQDDNIRVVKAKEALKNWFGILIVIGSGVILFSREIISVLTHGKFVSAAPLVSLWFILILIYSFGLPYEYFLLAHKKNKIVFFSDIIVGIISWGIIGLFIKLFGGLGAVLSILLYFFLLYSTRKFYATRLKCDNFGNYDFILALYILLSLVALRTYTFSIGIKCIIFFPLSALISYHFRLFSLLRFLRR